MKRAMLWCALAVLVIAAAVLSVSYFEPAAAALQGAVRPGPLSPRHAYLGERCSACHEATVGVTVAKCTACHANSERLLGRQPTAFHESIGECATCHVEHQGDGVRPSKMDHTALARVGARTLASAAPSDRESALTLASLEVWLHVNRPGQLKSTSTRAALDCAGCHDRRDPHLKRFGGDCALCHTVESWKVAGYQHPSPDSKECVQCHQPPPSHFMGHFSMVSRRVAGKEHARVEECFACHNTTGWNDIVDVGYVKHH